MVKTNRETKGENMLLKLEEDVVINTDQIVSVTKSNMTSRPSKIAMSDGSTHFHAYAPESLSDKIAKMVAAADTYYFTGL